MNSCELFDKYRDQELSIADREKFEAHVALCYECRTKKSLLDNVVYLIRREEVRPLNLAEQIARKAFEPKNSWASDVISWLRPAPALLALLVVGFLISSMWMITGNRQVNAYAEYEALMEETDTSHVNSLSQKVLTTAHGDSDIALWLAQEGKSQ